MEVRPYMRGGVRVVVSKRRWRIYASATFWRAIWRKARAAGQDNPLALVLSHVRQTVGMN